MRPAALVIVNFSSETVEDTRECLDSLKKVEPTPHIFLINHDSSSSFQDLYPHLTQVKEDKNIGFSGFHNIGIKKAIEEGYEYIGLLNNDTTVEPDFLRPLLDTLSKKKVGLVSPKIYFYPGREYHQKSYQESEKGKVIWYAGGVIDWANMYAYHWGVDEVDHGQFQSERQTDFATGCMTLFRPDVIEKVGLLDESYFLYYEDTDFSHRIKKTGYEIQLQPKSVIYHKNAGSTGGSGSKTHQYYQERNRLHFGLKYAPVKTRIALIKEVFNKLKSATSIEKKAVSHALLGKTGRQQV